MTQPPDKLVKETTTMAVYKRLFDYVMSGQFEPGIWIRERQLKEMLGVSSTPIREALRMLVQEQVLESVPHHGVRIKDYSIKEIQDYYELRAELEGLAAELAAERGSKLMFDKMEEILHLHRTFETERSDEAIELNNQFHDLIVEASENLSLKNTLQHLRVGINWIQVMAWNRNKDRHFSTYHQHQGILDALMARNSKLARSRMQEHVWDSIKLIIESPGTLQMAGELRKS
ncbi:DNA-binding transcriptional regulator, GntR family [Paenibacillus sophorae]|uniref:DNA-binding transcriptional regulator, GntR family n=1 Tax=Paenibacillus sophorae TaxID=1333845 RepID=A0A1H8KV41_9BACL|nr:GntR family transcriptional regulator [Paenibacillus sophorae]QWU17556.1 GntR family transcriptional regulator [Paenibacillus sophorae]SEN96772.1 DNA-binding transcriptional regulator, GntR family [Paenibacillus sophorae]